MPMERLYHATRLAVSCARSPPTDAASADVWPLGASRAVSALWLLEQRLGQPWDEEKTEVWRVPRLSPPRWRAAWTRAVDDLVAYESATPRVPDEAERLVHTWYRVLISLASHFDTLYSERTPG